MAHIQGETRNQYSMLPPVLEDWIPKDHPARVVEIFVESLNLKELGFQEQNEKTGYNTLT